MATANRMRALNRLPYDFEDGLKIAGVDVTTLNQISTANGAGLVGFAPVGGLSSINVQSAIAELDTEKVGKTELADTEGAALVGYDSINARTVFDNARPIADYTALRAYTGRAAQVRITSTDIAGFFYYDSGDTTSLDNGGTVIVSSNGRRWKRLFEGAINVMWFGAKGDWNGTTGTDDTAAIQSAVAYAASSNTKKVTIPYGVTGVYKVTGSIQINSAGITIEWQNNSIDIKKFHNGSVFYVNAGLVVFINPGIDGNGASGFAGPGIYFNDATFYTHDCEVINPRIRNTIDSCLLIKGPRGASGLVVRGGSMLTYNNTGSPYGGYPSVRLTGAQDGDVTPRLFDGVTSSAQTLIDVTGMWCTRIVNCFTGTIFFRGNPDVTGLPILPVYDTQCAEVFIDNTYVRGGLIISGSEVKAVNCLSHGNAPIFSTYGGGETSFLSGYSWEVTSKSVACVVADSNSLTYGVLDNSPNGVATSNQSSVWNRFRLYPLEWTSAGGTPVNPLVGNGSFTAGVSNEGTKATVTIKITFGSTSSVGSGERWHFSLPYWTQPLYGSVGTFSLYLANNNTWINGTVVPIDTGATHRVALVAANGQYIGPANPATPPSSGSILQIRYTYQRG